MARKDNRREPYFEEARRGELRADPRDRPDAPRSRSRSASPPKEPPCREPPKPPRGRGRGPSRSSSSLLGRLFYWAFVLGIWGAIGLAALVLFYGARLPPIDQLAVPKRPPNVAILSLDGDLIANRGDMGGAAIKISELPPYLPKAFVAIEDRRFYSHWGLDPQGLARALLRDVLHRGGMQGGSTLTQQLAKNLFLTQERTLSRKIQEAILALWLERKYSKDLILELYLNRVYFGGGAYGVEAAAHRYYGHGAREITLPEAAVLAGLMKAPSKLAPDRNPQGAQERAEQVLNAMREEGFITPAQLKGALAKPARAKRDDGAGTINYAADYVMDALADKLGSIDEDLVVTTTIDKRLQRLAEQALTEELDKKGEKFGVTQGAVVALDPTGAVRALVGGRDYGESQFDRAASAKRQPGSAFKPFVYLAGVEHGLTPDTVREDGPLNVKGWQPENYSREYFGPVTLTRALSLSLNTVAVRVGLEVGPKAVVSTAHRLGVASDLQTNASIALGTSEVTPLELVSAYTPFANGGIGVQPHVVAKVLRATDGRVLYQWKNASNGRVIEPRHVAMMNTMMRETLVTGTARKAELPGWPAAGKTGTSQDFRDAWFVGYTSRLVAGVWLGNDDNSPTKHVTGGNLPVEVWSRFMREALRGAPPADLPGGYWNASQGLSAPDLVENVLDFLRGGAPPPNPPPPIRTRALSPAPAENPPSPAPAEDPPPPSPAPNGLTPPADIPSAPPSGVAPRRPPQTRRESGQDFFESLFGR
ncbi:transglycosylase domain-containing protein [Methylocystis bryophila]|uniref:Penicillin-binding protein n=1 Tax=Methylocystis bryophila TaxID=655015 RepID=A0A1W6MZ07_9HYPH|nr:PBP1A family penicillin-binding protein [Methylocystis bryophila]ARN82793.1 penicillin-binding protein [Methylocystis bryophila]